MKITIDDIRQHHCSRGARRWFEQHGLDFKRFLREGIDADEFVATGDVRARQIVERKKQRTSTSESGGSVQ